MARSQNVAAATTDPGAIIIDFPGTVARLPAIAAEAGDALLTEGPVTPEHVLLDSCADIVHLLKQAETLGKQRAGFFYRPEPPTTAERAAHDELFA